jgi:hypothetical protein
MLSTILIILLIILAIVGVLGLTGVWGTRNSGIACLVGALIIAIILFVL